MSIAATTDKYNEIEGNRIFNYILIFFAVLIISGYFASTAIRLFQNDATQSMQVSPLVRVSPMEVAIAEAAIRPFATDPATPYWGQLREAAVLDSQVAVAVSGNSNKTDSSKDSTPVEILKPRPESSVAESSYVRKLRTVRRTVHSVSRTVKRHSADSKVLLARVERPVASAVDPKAVQGAPITEAVAKTIHEGGAVTETAALKPMGNISVVSAVPAQVNTGPSIASKPVEDTSAASIESSPVNTVSSVTSIPAAEKASAENKNSVSYSSSSHSPLVSPSGTDSDVKGTNENIKKYDASAGVPKEEPAGKDEKKEKGPSPWTVLEWTLKIVGIALVLLK